MVDLDKRVLNYLKKELAWVVDKYFKFSNIVFVAMWPSVTYLNCCNSEVTAYITLPYSSLGALANYDQAMSHSQRNVTFLH